MIQHPEHDEMLVEIPGKGLVLGFHAEMQRVFGARLLSGRRIETARGSAVEWDARGCVKPAADDAAVAAARKELSECVSAAEQTVRELTDLLKRSRGQPSIRVPRDLVRRMGGTSGEDHVFIAETEVRPRRDALDRTAAGVRRAMERGDFMLRDGRAVLFGWACLPRTVEVAAGPGPGGSVQLVLGEEHAVDERVIRELRWGASGSGSAIELVRVDGAEATVASTRESITTDPASGRWRFPSSQLPAGARYVARLSGPWGTVDSNLVEIPSPTATPSNPRVVVPPEPPGPPVSDPVGRSIDDQPPLPVIDPPLIGPDLVQERRWWPWILALALLLLALAFLLWLLLPYPRTRATWDRPLVAEHLPRFVSDIDLPRGQPRRPTAEDYGQLPTGFDPDRDAVVFDAPPNPPVFVDDGEIFVPDGSGGLVPVGTLPAGVDQPTVPDTKTPPDTKPPGGRKLNDFAPVPPPPPAPEKPSRELRSFEPTGRGTRPQDGPRTPASGTADPKPTQPAPAPTADPTRQTTPEPPPPNPPAPVDPRPVVPPAPVEPKPTALPTLVDPKPAVPPTPVEPQPARPPAPTEPKQPAPPAPRPPEPERDVDDREVRR